MSGMKGAVRNEELQRVVGCEPTEFLLSLSSVAKMTINVSVSGTLMFDVATFYHLGGLTPCRSPGCGQSRR